MHNIIPLSNIFLKEEELDYIKNKNEKYEKIIKMYQNYLTLNNFILDSYNNFKNNYYYIKNVKNLIRYIYNDELNNNSITTVQKDLQKQNEILEKFNSEYDTEYTLDTDVIYLNWKKITKDSLESLSQIEFKKLKEFQSVGTGIMDLSFLENSKFPILQELYLTDNNIVDLSILGKVNFPMLKIIYLNKNKIKDISVLTKVNFPALYKLFLDSYNINDISVFENIPFVNLEILKLSKNKISDITVLKKIKLKFLRFLDINKNKIDFSSKHNLDIINELRDKSIRIVY
jgi:Leucine-rich repeat (LRR) protein